MARIAPNGCHALHAPPDQKAMLGVCQLALTAFDKFDDIAIRVFYHPRRVVSLSTGLFWEIEHAAIYKPTPERCRIFGDERADPRVDALQRFEEAFERLMRWSLRMLRVECDPRFPFFHKRIGPHSRTHTSAYKHVSRHVAGVSYTNFLWVERTPIIRHHGGSGRKRQVALQSSTSIAMSKSSRC